MRRSVFIVVVVIVEAMTWQTKASSQTATIVVPSLTAPDPAPKGVIPTDITYPDAVVCDVTSPGGIRHRMIFYKSQTISFGTEPNNLADYGTGFISESNDVGSNKWHLQLGRPGNITVFAIPPAWVTANCSVGKPIARLAADGQLLELFSH